MMICLKWTCNQSLCLYQGEFLLFHLCGFFMIYGSYQCMFSLIEAVVFPKGSCFNSDDLDITGSGLVSGIVFVLCFSLLAFSRRVACYMPDIL